MSKPVSAAVPATSPLSPLPTPTNITKRVKSVAVRQLPPPTPPDSPRKVTKEFDSEEEYYVCYVTSKKKSQEQTPLDIGNVKDLMKKANQSAQDNDENQTLRLYVNVNNLFRSSQLDARALLVTVFCYLNEGKFLRSVQKDFTACLKKATQNLDLIARLIKRDCPEKQSCSFMYSLACAQLAISCDDVDSRSHQKTKSYFEAASKLLSESSMTSCDTLRQKILFGQSLAYFYDTRRELAKAGTKKNKDDLIKNLNISRNYLERSLEIHSKDEHKVLLAFIHSLIGLILEEKFLSKPRASNDKICAEAEKHLQLAKEILEALAKQTTLEALAKQAAHDALAEPEVLEPMTVKTCNMMALLGALQYKQAFNSKKVDYAEGYEAIINLSEAYFLSGSESVCLKLAEADAHRQIAWLLPVEVMQHRAEDALEEAASMDTPFNFSAQSNLHVYHCQAALWNLRYSSIKLVNLENRPEEPEEFESISTDHFDVDNLKQEAKARHKALQKMREEPSSDRLANAPENLAILEEFSSQVLKDLFVLEDLGDNGRIDLALLNSLKKQLTDDLNVIQILKKAFLFEIKNNVRAARNQDLLELRTHLGLLKSLLKTDSSRDSFVFLKSRLMDAIELFEAYFSKLFLLPETKEEEIAYSALIEKMGNTLDGLYRSVHFKHLLMDRVQNFDLIIECELDPL